MSTPSSPVPVWLDCDPGHDDAFAILLATYHPGIELLGISTVHGNAPLRQTTENALSLLAAFGKHESVRVYPGAARAASRPPVHATDIHGESGIDGTSLLPKCQTPPAFSLSDPECYAKTIDAMAEELGATPPNTAWVVATGAATNIAKLFLKHPHLKKHIKGVSLMAGSIGEGFTDAIMGRVDDRKRIGNYSQWAEFNVLIDPEAMRDVLEDEILREKVTLVPLDLTHLCLATNEVREMLLWGREGRAALMEGQNAGEGKSKLRRMLNELLGFFASTYRDVFGITTGPPLHDPLALAIVLIGTEYEIPFYDFAPSSDPGNKQPERFEIKIITDGTLEDAHKGAQTGRTVAKRLPPGQLGVQIPRGLDIRRFWNVVRECIERADESEGKIFAEV